MRWGMRIVSCKCKTLLNRTVVPENYPNDVKSDLTTVFSVILHNKSRLAKDTHTGYPSLS